MLVLISPSKKKSIANLHSYSAEFEGFIPLLSGEWKYFRVSFECSFHSLHGESSRKMKCVTERVPCTPTGEARSCQWDLRKWFLQSEITSCTRMTWIMLDGRILSRDYWENTLILNPNWGIVRTAGGCLLFQASVWLAWRISLQLGVTEMEQRKPPPPRKGRFYSLFIIYEHWHIGGIRSTL